MKIFLLADYYGNYLSSFYTESNLSSLNYQDHRERLLNDYFGSFVSYYRHFKQIGHSVELVIGNDYSLQNKWLKENNITLTACPANKKKVVLLQIEEFQPDVFFMGSMFDYYGDFLKRVSNTTKNIFTWIACPYSEDLDFSHIKCVISSAQMFVYRFQKKGLNAALLKAAFDKDIINFLDNQKTITASFIGCLSKKTHKRRVQGLEYLAQNNVDLKVFGYGMRRSFLPFFRSPLEKKYAGPVWGIEMYRVLNRSKISLNFHIDVAEGFSGNMRMYEATGCASLLMTEETDDIDELFKMNEEVIVFKDYKDLLDKIGYYISHDKERKEIIRNGQMACLKRHGYDQRIREFENILLTYCD